MIVRYVEEEEGLVGGAKEVELRDRVELVAMEILLLLEVAMHCRQVDIVSLEHCNC